MEPVESGKKTISKKKLINKVRRKNKRRMQRLTTSYEGITKDGSALGKLMRSNEPEIDFDMTNQITAGQSRKIKRKMKKLKKQYAGEDADDKIFNEVQKYKSGIIKTQQRNLFNPVSLMQKRREKRMKKMQENTRNSKKQVFHKNQTKKQ